MAGYLFNLSSEEALQKCIDEGFYATLMNPSWHDTVASTLGDYVTLKEGDNVYFFRNRKVYGIGRVVLTASTPVFENYPNATSSCSPDLSSIEDNTIAGTPIEYVENSRHELVPRSKRWGITFEGDPAFLPRTVDMDDLLSSDPRAFRNLRVMWQRSFIKLDDEENQALRALLLKRNIPHLLDGKSRPWPLHDAINKIAAKRDTALNVPGLLKEKTKKRGKDKGSLESEKLLEAGLLYQLAQKDESTTSVFGEWDYLSHQVPASPMKAIKWMDMMDIFGYRWIKGYEPVVESYLVVELKKLDSPERPTRKRDGSIEDKSPDEDVQQIMKYVDWIKDEYADGDYSQINAFLVAKRFDLEVIKDNLDFIERKFVVDRRPARVETWNNLNFVTYDVEDDGHIQFALVDI